jgi:hypothetical protein
MQCSLPNYSKLTVLSRNSKAANTAAHKVHSLSVLLVLFYRESPIPLIVCSYRPYGQQNI